MAQSSFNIGNIVRSLFRSSVNSALQALASNSSGPSAPTETYPFMYWADTATNQLKQRNAANNGWIVKGTLDAVNNGLTTPSDVAALISPVQGFKNVIINGDMVVAQRGVSFTGIATTPIYTLDRWRVSQTTSNTFTASQDADIPSSKVVGSSLALTVTGTADSSIAASDFSMLTYGVEGYDARRFFGKTFTFSFWVKSSLTGTYHISLFNGASSPNDRSYLAQYTVNAANTWEKKTITVVNGLPNTNGTWLSDNRLGVSLRFVLAAGTTFQNATTGSWLTGNFLATSSQVNLVGTVGNTFKITDVQMELGSAATDFEILPYDLQLLRAQRYFERSYNPGDALGAVTTSGQHEFGFTKATAEASHAIRTSVPYRTRKRTAAPTVTTYSPGTGTANRVRHAAGSDITPTITAYGELGFSLEAAQAVSLADWRYAAHWVSDAEL